MELRSIIAETIPKIKRVKIPKYIQGKKLQIKRESYRDHEMELKPFKTETITK